MGLSIYTCCLTVTFFISLCLTSGAYALSPVAHTDVVPYQRINDGETFNFGVVAFSKPGIDRVEFSIDGLGYAEGKKISHKMTLNTRVASDRYTGVYEYHVPISSSEFNGDGIITVTPVVYDNNGNERALFPVPLVVEGSKADFGRKKAWVNQQTGSDSSGIVGSATHQFETIQAAIDAAQAANNGSSSGNIIYLAKGTYNFSGLTGVTATEYLTIKRQPGTLRENVVVNQGVPNVPRLKVEGLTLESNGSEDYVLNSAVSRLWVDSCHLKGSGRNLKNSQPVVYNVQGSLAREKQYYATNNYSTNLHTAYAMTNLIRGAVVEGVGFDLFANFLFVVNSQGTNLDNGTTPQNSSSGAHTDALQVWQNNGGTVPVENRLAYNVFVTDAHYQGIMRSSVHQPAKNNAYVNVFIEMRDPTNWDLGTPRLKSGIIGSNDDHLIMWHCSFPYAHMSIKASNTTNSSFIGNLFFQVNDTETPHETTEWLNNHFMYAYGIPGSDKCTPTSADIAANKPCPWKTSKVIDTGSNTATTGGGVVDISENAKKFGYPLPDSDLIDAISHNYVLDDALGNARDTTPDIGALEYKDGINLPESPMNLKIQRQ